MNRSAKPSTSVAHRGESDMVIAVEPHKPHKYDAVPPLTRAEISATNR